MKYEPLKNKKESASEMLDTVMELIRNAVNLLSNDSFTIDDEEWIKVRQRLLDELKVEENGTEYYIGDGHIKSAIEGLQHDIMYEKEFTMFPRSGRKALELVKKWFPDVTGD